MIQFNKKLLALLSAVLLVAGITGCQKNDPAGTDPAGTTPSQSQPAR
jgi:hypothetical protein